MEVLEDLSANGTNVIEMCASGEPVVTYRGRSQVVVVPRPEGSHRCCVGDEGSEVEDGGNAVIHHHLEEERNRKRPMFPVFSTFSSFSFTFVKNPFFFQMTSTSLPKACAWGLIVSA